ncbi:ROK family protein [Auraticoccus monumenti]|uniref:Glucokinase n=1 Tax=Auraticoccus monumenti TaxID=675864 RepID=A0A1G7A4F2_9ACTN|nr:ROK family protein [Auraticoccus monumenti]SDE09641.1 glucokinase [Auraticoccus monumenti]
MSAPLLGVDLGGTSTKLLLGRPGPDGAEPLEQTQVPTPRGPGALDLLADRVQAFLAGRTVAAAGVTVPGLLDGDGVVTRSVNLPWLDGVAVGDVLGTALGVPVVAVHDGRAAARAEAVLGAGRGHADVYVLTLGTGIAGAQVIGGQVLAGAHLSAGEVGHVSQDDHGRLCSCGQRGCLETLVGAEHLARRWQEVLAAEGSTPQTAPTARDLVEAARAGHPGASAVLDQATTALARALLALLATVDPGLVVVGGGLGQAADVVVAPAVVKLTERATFHSVPPVVPSALGPWAGAWGAVLGAADQR